jgi:DNA helicase-2/ATP-dependent DNA helicase PcrA
MHEVKEKLEKMHTDDKGNPDIKQLDVVFSEEDRIIVEAPAGYGKTKTMISKIAYMIADNQIHNPKKVLALTYSVNAAYKIRRDISKDLPEIFNDSSVSPLNVTNKVFATNYHGLCRTILHLYGYLIDPNLRNMDKIIGINELSDTELYKAGIRLNMQEKRILAVYNRSIKEQDLNYLKNNFNSYLNITKDKFLPNCRIPFNAIILLVFELFKEYPETLKFYKKYFPIIIVDEFQDTNLLSWQLLKLLIGDNTKLIFMGDSLQRIYGFIGAIDKIMDIAENRFNMKKIELETNHRFKNNPKLLKLDTNIRENAKNIVDPNITSNVLIDVLNASDQISEADKVYNYIKDVLECYPDKKVIILLRRRKIETDIIIEKVEDLNYFYALFSEEDLEYINFHQDALLEFSEVLDDSGGIINKIVCEKFLRKIDVLYSADDSQIILSLKELLKSFLKIIFNEYKFLNTEQKIRFIKDTLETRTLKQYLEYVDSNLIISTIHGSKGLEWDFVVLPDMEANICPSFLCQRCIFQTHNCNVNVNIQMPNYFKDKFFDELNVFYVGSTRAKEDTIFSYSDDNISCFLKLKGLDLNLI